jgi:hypothetical protein
LILLGSDVAHERSLIEHACLALACLLGDHCSVATTRSWRDGRAQLAGIIDEQRAIPVLSTSSVAPSPPALMSLGRSNGIG